MKYKTKDIFVDALRWDGTEEGLQLILSEFLGIKISRNWLPPLNPSYVKTYVKSHVGKILLLEGNWIVMYSPGVYEIMPQHIFKEHFEKVGCYREQDNTLNLCEQMAHGEYQLIFFTEKQAEAILHPNRCTESIPYVMNYCPFCGGRIALWTERELEIKELKRTFKAIEEVTV